MYAAGLSCFRSYLSGALSVGRVEELDRLSLSLLFRIGTVVCASLFFLLHESDMILVEICDTLNPSRLNPGYILFLPFSLFFSFLFFFLFPLSQCSITQNQKSSPI